jgi:hypothetical protein
MLRNSKDTERVRSPGLLRRVIFIFLDVQAVIFTLFVMYLMVWAVSHKGQHIAMKSKSLAILLFLTTCAVLVFDVLWLLFRITSFVKPVRIRGQLSTIKAQDRRKILAALLMGAILGGLLAGLEFFYR